MRSALLPVGDGVSAIAVEVAAHRARYEQHVASVAAMSDVLGEHEWLLVVRFYAAMHLAEAYLRTKKEPFHASRHEQRWKALKACPELRKGPFLNAFRKLKEVSEQVRYDPAFVASPTHAAASRTDLSKVESMLAAKIEKFLLDQSV